MNVLVSGGRNPEYLDRPPVAFVREICFEIGSLLASNGHIIFSGESPGIDEWVTAAAKDACVKMGLDPRDRIKVYYHWSPAHQNGELIRSRHSDRIAGVPEIVEYSRCGILLSGFTGTEVLAQWLKKYHKPIIPVGASGGAAKRLLDEMLSSGKYSKKEFELLQVISSDSRTPKEIAQAVLDLMDLMTPSEMAPRITQDEQENLISIGGRGKIERALKADFGIVTALAVERDAVLKRMDNVRTYRFEQEDIQTYYKGLIRTDKGAVYEVVVIMTQDLGTVEAALATGRLIHKWEPKYIVMVGIAGGTPKGGLELGDVVVGSEIWEYDYSKITPKGEERRPRCHRADALLLDRVNACSNWEGHVDVPRPKSSKRKYAKLFVGVIASGNKVIACKKYREDLESLHPKILAVEMEAEGVAAAAWQIPNPKGTLVIRGITDFGDEKKRDEWREYAANSVATFLFDFLRTAPIEPEK